jgi:hypothetical protein
MSCTALSAVLIDPSMIVTECLRRTTHCHDNFGYCTRKHMIRFGMLRERGGPLLALLVVTYASGFVVVDTFSAVKG